MSTEKKARFTVFDGILIVLMLCVAAVIAYMLIVVPMQSMSPEKDLEFMIEVPTTTQDIASLIHTGDTVTVSGKGKATVTDVIIEPAEKLVLDAITGAYKFSEVPERYDLYVTVRASATETDKEIAVQGTPVLIGEKLSVEGKGYSVNGAVLDMAFGELESEVSR